MFLVLVKRVFQRIFTPIISGWLLTQLCAGIVAGGWWLIHTPYINGVSGSCKRWYVRSIKSPNWKYVLLTYQVCIAF